MSDDKEINTQNLNKSINDANDSLSEPTKPGFFSFENLRSLGVMILIILAVRWSVASPYHVPTASMEPTIKVGDRLLAFKLAYNLKIPFTDITVLEWSKPERGDIIVFRYPEDPSLDYVKRVVGLPGDKIQLLDDVLYINGEPQNRTDFDHDRSILDDIHDSKISKQLLIETLIDQPHWVMQEKSIYNRISGRTWPRTGVPYEVPQTGYFVMGDNRDNSSDSRVWKHVPEEYIRGKATFVIWSNPNPPESWVPAFRVDRFGHWLDSEVESLFSNKSN